MNRTSKTTGTKGTKNTSKKGAVTVTAEAILAAETSDTRPVVAAEAVVEEQVQAAPVAVRVRDPRLPPAGTPMIRQWHGKQVVVVESGAGLFTLGVDGEIQVTGAKSLSAVVATFLTSQGKNASVNGYFWMKVGTGALAPRPRKAAKDPIPGLTAAVEKALVRFNLAANRAAEAETALFNARKALAEAKMAGLDAADAADKAAFAVDAQPAAETTPAE